MPKREDGIWTNIFRGEKEEESEEDLRKKLHQVPIFSELGQRELKQIIRIAHRRHYVPGEVVVHEGQPSAGMYIILKGKVNVSRRSPQGLQIDITNMGEGEFFGDVGLLDNAPRTATVTATTDCDLLGFFRPELLSLIDTDPKLASKVLLKLAHVLAARLRFTDSQLEQLAEAAQKNAENSEEDESNPS